MTIEEEQFPGLGIKISEHKQFCLVQITIAGNIDLYNCSELKEILEEGNKDGILDWILDLSSIKFIDSSGLGVLANQAMLLKRKEKQLILLGLQKTTQHLFNMPGLTKIFKTINDLNEL